MREARLRAASTQVALAERVGRPQSQISRWERGDVRPSLETLRELVRACGIDLTYGLAAFDDSYDAFINRLLAMTPAERLTDASARERAYFQLRGAPCMAELDYERLVGH